MVRSAVFHIGYIITYMEYCLTQGSGLALDDMMGGQADMFSIEAKKL